MPTKRPRLNVTFPDQAYYDIVERVAIAKRHSMSDLILVALDEYLDERKKMRGFLIRANYAKGNKLGPLILIVLPRLFLGAEEGFEKLLGKVVMDNFIVLLN